MMTMWALCASGCTCGGQGTTFRSPSFPTGGFKTELRSSDLPNGCFYSLSHLPSPFLMLLFVLASGKN